MTVSYGATRVTSVGFGVVLELEEEEELGVGKIGAWSFRLRSAVLQGGSR